MENFTSNITFLELVEVTLQLLEIVSNVGPDIDILRGWKKHARLSQQWLQATLKANLRCH